MSYFVRYAFYGVLFGAMFPIFSYFVKDTPSLLFYIICSAPFVLGIVFAFMGRKQDEVVRKNLVEKKISMFYEYSPFGFAFCDMEGNLIEVNKEYVSITGYSFEELKNLSYWDITPKKYEKDEEAQLKSLEETGRYGPYRKEYRKKDGSLVPVELNGFIVFDYDGQKKGIWSIIENISSKIESEQELERQKNISSHNAKLASLGEMASGVGHEIKNPLAISVGNVQIIRNELGRENINFDKIIKRLGKIEKANERIRKIVDGLRTFSRIDDDMFSIINLNDVIFQTIDFVTEFYSQDGVNLTWDIEDKKHLINGNSGKIQQILMNLISNAKDATKGLPERNISITLNEVGDNVHLSVVDNGEGIPEQIKEKILEPFFTTKKHGEGTGIGLDLSNKLVRQMNGSIEINSKVGIGTAFTLIFPLCTEEQEKTIEFMNPFVELSLEGTALVVDDEEGIREVLSEMLRSVGIDVTESSNGKDALALISEINFDYVFTDLNMPMMNGDILIQEAKQFENRKTKYFIVSGIGAKSNRDMSYADGFLPKPFSKEHIIRLLK